VSRGASAEVDTLDAVVTDRFLRLAGGLRVVSEVSETTAPDTRRTDLTDALRVARGALADAVETADEEAEHRARSLVVSLRAELDRLPADAVTTRRRVYTGETYAQLWQRLDTAGRRELLAPLVTVTLGHATLRDNSGHYMRGREALEARVSMAWADDLEAAIATIAGVGEPDAA
jgi:hypothetical protein